MSERIKPGMPGYFSNLLATCKLEDPPVASKRLMHWHVLGERIGTDEIARAWRGGASEPYTEPY